MKQFLLGAAVATAVLGAAGFAAFKEPAAAVAVKKTMPLKLSDLTLDRAFRITVPITGNPVVVPSDPTVGLVITEISSNSGNPYGLPGLFVSVNGATPEFIAAGNTLSSPYQQYVFKNPSPPLIVRPGDTLTLWNNLSTGASGVPYTLGGYFVYPGEV